MRTLWKSSLALSLGILVTGARAEEVVWRQASPIPPTGAASAPTAPSQGPLAELQRPIARAPAPRSAQAPVAALGRPVAIAGPATTADRDIQPVTFSQPSSTGPIFRGAI